MKGANFIEIININDNYIPNTVFTRASYRKTLITSDCTCVNTKNLLLQASVGRFLNKTYQWFLWSVENQNAELFIPSGMKYLGPNSQLTFINGTKSTIKIWSVYSNGMHLKSPLKTLLIGSVRRNESAQENIGKYILDAQLTRKRNQFHGLTLRGVTVVSIYIQKIKIMQVRKFGWSRTLGYPNVGLYGFVNSIRSKNRVD